MWDVSNKENSSRTAVAQSVLRMLPETIAAVRNGTVPKGDPFAVARVAAVLAAKRTPDIVPYCHPLPITHVGVEFDVGDESIKTTVTVRADYKTGVEMEALTAASVAALTLYDMLKQLDMAMSIERVVLLDKTGGKSDFHRNLSTA